MYTLKQSRLDLALSCTGDLQQQQHTRKAVQLLEKIV